MESGERELIQTALAGDPAAFESLMNAYALRVYAIAYAILQDRQDAEDCTQDAFFKAWRNRRQVREPAKFPAWLFAIARHTGQDRLRRRAARPLTVPFFSNSDDEAEPIADLAEADASPDADAAEQHRRVHALLSTLPERHRTALTLRYLEGLDHRGIEQAMDLSNGALRGVLSRALETMRRGLHQTATPSSLPDAL
jgi:RNA polymerase sigma-70 factor (ECF subfamily)